MANNAEFKLKYTIESDNSKAKKDVQEVDTLISKLFGKKTASSGLQSSFKEVASEVSNIVSELTGDRLSGAASQVTSLANAFGAIPGPAGLAIGAIAGIGTAAVGATAALFELTEKSAEYGESIYNAQVKTGLHANTLSAMQVAAKQSGVEFDQVTNSIQKFAQTVGQAAEGSDKAGKSLIALGLDPKKAADNLDESLDKVLKKIADAPTAVEKNTLAFQAFGKQGKELLPFIERFHGDLPELTAELEKMGVTIGDKDALAAHEFGDQMTLVTEQVEKTAIKIGSAFMPVFYQMSTAVSSWVAKNQNEITDWADKFAFAFGRIVTGAGVVVTALERYYKSYASFMEGIGLGFLAKPGFGFFEMVDKDYKAEFSKSSHESTGYGGGVPGGDLPDIYGKAKKPPKTTDAEFRKFFTDQGFEVSRTFGEAVNKGSLHPSGKAIDIKVGGKTEDEIAKLIANAIEKGYRFVDERVKQPGIISHGQHLHFEQNQGEKGSIFGPADSYGSVPLDLLKQIDQSRLGKGAAGSKAVSAFTKKELDLSIKDFETYWGRKLDIEQAGNNNLLALKEVEMDAIKQGGADYVTANEKAREIETIKLQQYQEEIDYLSKLEDYYRVKAATTTDLALKTDLLTKADETHQKIELKTIDAQTAKIKLDAEEKQSVKELTDKYYDLAGGAEAMAKATEEYIKATGGNVTESKTGTGSGKPKGFFQQILDQLGIDPSNQSVTDLAAKRLLDFKDLAVNAVTSMTDAVAQSIEQWELYGGSVGQAMERATAAVLAQISAQALVKGLFYTAEGVAALFLNPPAAAGFFEAAAIDFAIAGGAGLGAHFLSKAAGGKGQGKGGGSSSYSYNSSTDNANKNPTPYSRVSDDAYISGSHSEARFVADAIKEHTDVMKQIYSKLDSMPAHAIVTKASQQRPGIIGNQAVHDVSKDSSIGTRFLKAAGQRR